jgi:hypothetical protein
MGKTYKKQSNKFDDEFSSKRSGKQAGHAIGKKTGGMKTLNSFVDEDYDDPFKEELEVSDEIQITHTKNTNT